MICCDYGRYPGSDFRKEVIVDDAHKTSTMTALANLASPPPSISGGSGGSSGSSSGAISMVVSELEELDFREIQLMDVRKHDLLAGQGRILFIRAHGRFMINGERFGLVRPYCDGVTIVDEGQLC